MRERGRKGGKRGRKERWEGEREEIEVKGKAEERHAR